MNNDNKRTLGQFSDGNDGLLPAHDAIDNKKIKRNIERQLLFCQITQGQQI